MPEKFEFQQYRDNLAEEIKKEPDKGKRKKILDQAKITNKYREARRLKIEEVNRVVEMQEGLDLEREKLGLEPQLTEVITTRQAVEELQSIYTEREPYSLDKAKEEKPLMHYSKGGNIFQILRFGIQSNNFKNRFNELREVNPAAENLAKQMCGLRIKQGGSYQEQDSISLSQYQSDLFVRPGNVLYLINPEIKTFGGKDEEREQTGYGHGIKKRTVAEEYEVGNPTAYKDEVLVANIILPKELKAIVVDNFSSLLSDLNMVVSENTMLFMNEQKKNPDAAEDLTATARLIEELCHSSEIISEIDKLQEDLKNKQMTRQEIAKYVQGLQRNALAEFVGKGKKLNEASLREVIEQKFGIQIINKNKK